MQLGSVHSLLIASLPLNLILDGLLYAELWLGHELTDVCLSICFYLVRFNIIWLHQYYVRVLQQQGWICTHSQLSFLFVISFAKCMDYLLVFFFCIDTWQISPCQYPVVTLQDMGQFKGVNTYAKHFGRVRDANVFMRAGI